jgi:biopolymer transport protein TolR
MMLTVSRDRSVYFDKERVARVMLNEKLSRIAREQPDVTLYLRADRDVPYGAVVEVMDAVKRAGIDRLGMVTQPAGEGADAP